MSSVVKYIVIKAVVTTAIVLIINHVADELSNTQATHTK